MTFLQPRCLPNFLPTVNKPSPFEPPLSATAALPNGPKFDDFLLLPPPPSNPLRASPRPLTAPQQNPLARYRVSRNPIRPQAAAFCLSELLLAEIPKHTTNDFDSRRQETPLTLEPSAISCDNNLSFDSVRRGHRAVYHSVWITSNFALSTNLPETAGLRLAFPRPTKCQQLRRGGPRLASSS